jgi:hypothetical protein
VVVVKWYHLCLPSTRRGFDSRLPHVKTLDEVKAFLKESMTPPAYQDAVDAIDTAIQWAYDNGHEDGYRTGTADGFDEGWGQAQERAYYDS